MRISTGAKITTPAIRMTGNYGLIISTYMADYKKREKQEKDAQREMQYPCLSEPTYRYKNESNTHAKHGCNFQFQ